MSFIRQLADVINCYLRFARHLLKKMTINDNKTCPYG